MTCQKEMMARGEAYPRTCQDCGFGPCKNGYPNWYIPGQDGPLFDDPASLPRKRPSQPADVKLPSEAKPVAWRIGYTAMGIASTKWHFQNEAPTPVNWDYVAEPLYSQSDFDAMQARASDLSAKLHEAQTLLHSVSLALEGLTPGGSEYISYSSLLEMPFADTEACRRVIRERFEGAHAAKLKSADLSRENAELRAEVERLREALGQISDETEVHTKLNQVRLCCKFQDIAARALSPSVQEGENG